MAADGGIFSFTTPFFGSEGSNPPAASVAGLAVTPAGTGYAFVDGTGPGAAYRS